MNIILFIAVHFFSAFGIFYFFNEKNVEKLKDRSILKIAIILLIMFGLIGNYFLSEYILTK